MGKRSITVIVNKKDMTLRPIDISNFNFILDGFEDGQELTMTLEPFVRIRSLSQNSLFYKYISIISDETGGGTDKEEIKNHVKKIYGAVNENGKLKSTSDYTSVEMNKLIEGTRLFAATELGINLPLPDELRFKNIK